MTYSRGILTGTAGIRGSTVFTGVGLRSEATNADCLGKESNRQARRHPQRLYATSAIGDQRYSRWRMSYAHRAQQDNQAVSRTAWSRKRGGDAGTAFCINSFTARFYVMSRRRNGKRKVNDVSDRALAEQAGGFLDVLHAFLHDAQWK